MTTIDDLDDHWADHLDREADRAEDDYREFCDAHNLDPLTSRAHRAWSWRNTTTDELGAGRLGALAAVAAFCAVMLGVIARVPLVLAAVRWGIGGLFVAACIWVAWPAPLREGRR